LNPVALLCIHGGLDRFVAANMLTATRLLIGATAKVPAPRRLHRCTVRLASALPPQPAAAGSGGGDTGSHVGRSPYLALSKLPGTRTALTPPSPLLAAVDSVLAGRNLPALTQHWTDMLHSLRDRAAASLRADADEAATAAAVARGALGEDEVPVVQSPSSPLLYGPQETLAYVLHSLLPSYAIAMRLLGEAAQAMPPGWQPRSMLDIGCGPGAGVLAALHMWPHHPSAVAASGVGAAATVSGVSTAIAAPAPGLWQRVVCVDPSRSMTQVAEHVLSHFPTPPVQYRRSLDELVKSKAAVRGSFDLVMLHYTLAQMRDDAERDAATAIAWDAVAPGGMLLVSEHGDKWGFRVVRRARDALLHRAAATVRFAPQLRSDAPAALTGGVGAAGVAPSPPLHLLSDSDFVASGPTDAAAEASDRVVPSAASAAPSSTPTVAPPLPHVAADATVPVAVGSAAPPPAAHHISGSSLKRWLRDHNNPLRPPMDLHGAAVLGPCPHAKAVSRGAQ